MINTKTLLILGAGSNKQYGFPTARELIDRIGQGLNPDSNGPLRQVMAALHFQHDLIADFRRDLLGSYPRSIDTFLGANENSRYEEIGKAAIAAVLLENECSDFMKHQNLVHTDGWYTDLFSLMTDSVRALETFVNNRIKIVSFNYDRSIEYFLGKKLQHFFRTRLNDISDAINYLSFLEVKHVHGALGSLVTGHGARDILPYGMGPTPGNIKSCIDNIRVIHESGDSNSYDDIYSLVQRSEKVLFLGFSYGEENLQRLFKNSDVWNGKFIYGSTLGLTGQNFQRVKKVFIEKGRGPFFNDQEFDKDDKCEQIINKYLL